VQGGEQTPGADHGVDPGTEGTRTWVHPSEIGLRCRVRSDRRRARLLVGGVVVCGATLLLVSARLPQGDAAARRVGSSAAPMSVGVVGVEPLDAGADMTTGLVVDGGGHVVLPLSQAGADPHVRVHCGDAMYDAVIVATDPDAGIAVVEVDSPREVAPLPSSSVAEGDELTLTTVGGDGQRRASQVRVTEVGDGGGTPAFLAEGARSDHGVLSTPDGQLAGWVTSGHPGAQDGEVVALAARPLMLRATQLVATASAGSAAPAAATDSGPA
jgi:hypothetical protein